MEFTVLQLSLFFNSWRVRKYDNNTEQFNILDTIDVCQNCGNYGVLANPEDTTFFMWL